ncbi:MAG: hypothetical protein QOI41_5548 [Myxococcales bacterium]|nr:hypothetical protein [Myxococcales bacterium]
MSTPVPTPPVSTPITAQLSRFAWPAAFVAVAAMTFGYLHDARPKAASEVRIEHPTPTVLRDLREMSRLETLSLHVEKVVDVKDRQTRLYGLVDAEDSLLFVATGEVVLGVDLGKLGDADARYDEATRTAYIHLPAPEVLSTRFDEPHSYVHARATDVLARRNEALESIARRDATIAFEAAAKDPKAIDRAKEQAEKQLRGLGKAWGARDVVITWRPDAGSSTKPSTML